MGCNCATQEQIDKLYEKYGEKKKEIKNQKFNIKNILMKIGIYFCLVFITPIIFLYVFYKAFGDDDHRISVRKFFNLGKKQLGSNVG